MKTREDVSNELAGGEHVNTLKALTLLTKGSAITFLGIAMANIFNLARRLIVVRSLPKSDYGLFSLGWTILTLLIALASFGLLFGSQRFIAFYAERDELSEVRGTIMASIKIQCTSTLIIILALWLSIDGVCELFNEPELKSVLYQLMLILPIILAFNILISFFIGLKNVVVKFWFESLALNALSVIIIIIAFQVAKDAESVIFGFLLSYLLCLGTLLIYTKRRFPLSLKGVKSKPLTRRLLLFCIPLLFIDIMSLVISQTATIVLAYLKNVEIVGTFNAAMTFVQILEVFLVSLIVIFFPVITGMVAGAESEEIKHVYASVTKWVFVFSIPLFFMFFLFPQESIRLFFGEKYLGAESIVQILCVGKILHIIFGPNGELLVAYGKSKLVMVNAIAAGVTNILLCWFLIPAHGLKGAAIAFGVTLLVANLSTALELQHLYRVHPFNASFTRLLLSACIFIPCLFFPFRWLFSRVFWLVPVFYPVALALTVVLAIVVRCIDQYDRQLLSKIVMRIRSGIRP